MNEWMGLVSKTRAPIPLAGVAVQGDILGNTARVTVKQRYENRGSQAIEAIYKFPLPEGAAVCGFHVTVDGRTFRGEVEETQKAFAEYDRALAQGHGGFLLDQERPNIFTLSVGNMKPGSQAVIEIEYITLLDMEDARTRFFLPTTISPRYIPEDMPDRGGIPEDHRINPEFAAEVPYGLSLSLEVHQMKTIGNVDSPSHPIRIATDDNNDTMHISLSAESARMDRDFILYVGYREGMKNRAYRFVDNDESFYMIDFSLDDEKEEATARRKEMIFLVDCSGSMQGDSITEAKKALQIIVRGLDSDTAFNIYRFGSKFESLFSESMPFSEEYSHKALAFLDAMDADLGGTEIYAPLVRICSETRLKGIECAVVLMTDGEVGNEKQVMDLVRQNSHGIRFFTVGIGAGPNEFFIKGLARAGRGASEFIYPGERIEPKVLGLFHKVRRDAVDDLTIEFPDGSFEQAPAAPAVYPGSAMTIFARGEKGERDNNTKVTLTGTGEAKSLNSSSILVKGMLQGKSRTWKLVVSDEVTAKLPITALWARARIRDLESSGADRVSGSQQTERKKQNLESEIVALSKKYGILSSLTSYVAIEQRELKDRATGEIVPVKVPVLVTAGWHGLRSIQDSFINYSNKAFMAAPSMHHVKFASYERATDSIKPGSMRRGISKNIMQKRDGTGTDLLLDILSLQQAGGGLMLNTFVALCLKIDIDELKGFSASMTLSGGEDRFLVVSTAVLLEVLAAQFMSQKAAWGAVVDKSVNWLKNIVRDNNPKIGGRPLTGWAREYVRENLMV